VEDPKSGRSFVELDLTKRLNAYMRALRVLWVDLTTAVKEAEPQAAFRPWCDVINHVDVERLDDVLAQKESHWDLICFDFDYPDRAGLRSLRSTKASYPSLPIIMLTVQHSEALAIWAFRSKIWDYLVKPAHKREVERCLVGLSRALAQRNTQTPRRPATNPDRIPQEIALEMASEEHALGPAIRHIERHFRSTIRSESIAGCCNLSPFRFSRLFKETFGMTFRDYLINYRLREAYRLLENPNVTVADVAFAVGFNDPSYFTRIFKQRVGMAPSALIGHPREDSSDEFSLQLPTIPA
jgi:AraC-like DNA-binding protein